MEISEEDDDNSSSLIRQKFPQSQSSLISSSPLIRTRSSEKPSDNKENVYSNNVEVPSLGMKPMQMKSRRKGGGCNLRKSLAWDRAFFTDEGILDPLELTLITGINANTSRGELATISEEGNSSDGNFGNGYDDVKPSEEALCKDSHDTTRTSRGNRKKTDSSLANHDSSLHPKVTHKGLSVNRTKRAGSKVGGCSGPLAASSLKRPANSSIMRTAKKESKLLKVPISKPEPCLSAMTKGSIAPSHLRHNPIPKPTMDAKKNVSFKSYAKNVHEPQSKAKMSSGSVHLPTKELAKRTIRDLTKSSSKATSPTKSCLVRSDRSNCESEMVPDRLQLCKYEEESEPHAATNLARQTTTNVDYPFPDAARSISSGQCHNQRASNGPMISNRLHSFKSQECPAALLPHHVNPNNAGVPLHVQPAGPSGLRLPSPSLRFFDQKTTSECGSLKQKKFEQLNTSIGSNRKFGELRPPAVSARKPMKINDIKENPCSAPSTLSTPSGSTQLKDDAIWTTDIPDSGTMGKISITPREFPKDEGDKRGNTVATKSRDQFHSEVTSVSCIMPSESSALDKDPYTNGTEIFQEKSGLSYLDAVFLEVSDEKQDVKPLAEDLEYREAAPLIGAVFLEVSDDNSLPVKDDAIWTTDSPDSGTMGKVSITHREFPKEEGEKRGNTVATKSRDQFHSEMPSVSCIMPSESSAIDKDPYTNGTEIFQEKSGLSYPDDGSLEAGNPVSQVFVDSQTDHTRTREDDAHVGLVRYSAVLQQESIGQEDAAAKAVDDNHLLMKDDAIWTTDIPDSGTMGKVSITPREFPKDDGEKRGNTVATKSRDQFHSEVTSVSCIMPSESSALDKDPYTNGTEIFQEKSGLSYLDSVFLEVSDEKQDVKPLSEDSEYREAAPLIGAVFLEVSDDNSLPMKDDAIWTTDSPDIGTMGKISITPREFPKDEGEKGGNTVATKSTDQIHSELPSVSCITQSESSALDKDPYTNGTEIFQEKSGLSSLGAVFLEVSDEKQDVKPLAEDLEYREAAPLIGADFLEASDDKQFSLTASLGDAESIMQVAQYGSTYLTNLEKEGLDIIPAATEAEHQVHEDQKNQVTAIITGSFSEESVGAENSQHSHDNILEANLIVKIAEGSVAINNFSKTDQRKELCSDAGRDESILTSTYRIGDEGLKVNIGGEIDAGVFQDGKTSMADELHHDLDSGGDLKRNKGTTVLPKKPNDIKRLDNSLIIHPPNAVPFSDEWLAAIEAAGEEILTMKCGAVQHSPPDKSLPEPSPWSPVKKKVNQIGPYDCTKYTNAMPSNPH